MQTLTYSQPVQQTPRSPKQRMAEIRRLRSRRDALEIRLDEMDGGSLDSRARAVRIERNAINARIEALEALGDGGPLLTLTLDAYGSTLVRRALAAGDEAEGSDIVNGALAFTLGADDDHNWPEEAEKAAERRLAQVAEKSSAPDQPLVGHAVTIYLSPVQLRMFMQIADDSAGGTMAELVQRELGQHVALHLECYHGHALDAARQRWDLEGKEAA